MSTSTERSVSHQRVHRRFIEVFGQPDNTLGRDDHWALKPKVQYPLTINVLVNGMPELPAVWVFDPNDHKDGVVHIAVKDEEHLEQIILQIEDRVKRATAKGDAHPAARPPTAGS